MLTVFGHIINTLPTQIVSLAVGVVRDRARKVWVRFGHGSAVEILLSGHDVRQVDGRISG